MGKGSDIDISLANIWRSWQQFRRGKKRSRAILAFEHHLPENILRLSADINTGAYRHGGYDHKVVNEKKRRDIAVATVCDRIVHRLLYNHLVERCDKTFDYDVWSCRVGKGNTAALERAAFLFRKYPDGYVWRGDVQKFFDHVNHSVLWRCIQRYDGGSRMEYLLREVIRSYGVSAAGFYNGYVFEDDVGFL